MPLRRLARRLALCLAVCLTVAAPALSQAPAGRRAATANPDRVILTWQGDPARSQSVTWRTDTGVTGPKVQYVRASPDPRPELGAREVSASSSSLLSGTQTAAYHSADMTGLEPDTLYAYRVGDGVRWSEWNQFRTASAKPAPFSFIYLGDEQNNLLSSCARVLRQAFRQAPDARFIVHAGDLTNSANVDDEWREWHEVGGWLNAMVPSVPTPGNHQYGRFGEDPSAPSELTRHWKPQFALPLNGPAGLEESTYWFDYQGVRVISLNSCERQQEQVPWLTRVLEDNPNRWTVITFHHPIYSGAKGRDNKELRDAWKPIFERFKVDLVLQGHDHVYARSKPEPGSKSPVPVYVVSVCGQKMYDLKPGISTVRAGEDTQLYQVITVDGARLELAAYTASGELYDRFELRKGGGGSVSLREALPKNTPERHRPAKSGAAN